MIRLVRVNRTRFDFNKGLLRQRDTFLCIPLLGIVWKLWTKDRREPDEQEFEGFEIIEGSDGIQ